MSEARQLCPQVEGAILTNFAPPGRWDVVPAADYGGLGCAFFQIQDLDLRGLTAGNESGLYFDSISLQESTPWTMPIATAEETGVFVVYDMLTTVRPTRHTIAETFVRPDTGQNVCPGFLFPADTLTNDWPPSEQTLNPSQITWGLWRVFTNSMEVRVDDSWGLPMRILQSGYFGQGDYAVAPALYWTRMVFTLDAADAIGAPSANLLANARAEKITEPMEVSQMMRAAQR